MIALTQQSQLVRLGGFVGWLTYDAAHNEILHRQHFETAVMTPQRLAQIEPVTAADLFDFVALRRHTAKELSRYYATSTYTGD